MAAWRLALPLAVILFGLAAVIMLVPVIFGLAVFFKLVSD